MQNYNQQKGFSLIEMLMALLVASLLMVAMAPVMTKKFNETLKFKYEGTLPGLKNKSHTILYNDDNCKDIVDNGEYSICKGKFIVPSGFNGDIKVTAIGGGGGGGSALTSATVEYKTAGIQYFTVPAGVTELKVTIAGAGAGGSAGGYNSMKHTFVTTGKGGATESATNLVTTFADADKGVKTWAVPKATYGKNVVITGCGGGGGGGGGSWQPLSTTGDVGGGGGSGAYIKNFVKKMPSSDLKIYIGGGGGGGGNDNGTGTTGGYYGGGAGGSGSTVRSAGGQSGTYGKGGNCVSDTYSSGVKGGEGGGGDGADAVEFKDDTSIKPGADGAAYTLTTNFGDGGSSSVAGAGGSSTKNGVATGGGGGGGGIYGGGGGGGARAGAGGGGGGRTALITTASPATIIFAAPGGGGGGGAKDGSQTGAGGGGGAGEAVGGTGKGGGGGGTSAGGTGGTPGGANGGDQDPGEISTIFGANYCNGGKGEEPKTVGKSGKPGAVRVEYLDYSKGGLGGASGEWKVNQTIKVRPGDRLEIKVGTGGTGGIAGYINDSGTIIGTVESKNENTQSYIKDSSGNILISTTTLSDITAYSTSSADGTAGNRNTNATDTFCKAGVGGTNSSKTGGNATSTTGAPYGGCGGGGGYSLNPGGNGAAGYVKITWNPDKLGTGGGGGSANAVVKRNIPVKSGAVIEYQIGGGGIGGKLGSETNNIQNNLDKKIYINGGYGGDTIFGTNLSTKKITAGGGYGGLSPYVTGNAATTSSFVLYNGTGGLKADVCKLDATLLTCQGALDGATGNNTQGGNGANSKFGAGGAGSTNTDGQNSLNLGAGGGGAGVKICPDNPESCIPYSGGKGASGKILLEWEE